MAELHNYGLVRFSKKTGKIDMTLTALGCGMLELWGLQHTTKTKSTLIIDLDSRSFKVGYVGTEDGFPDVIKTEDEFPFNIPEELYTALAEEVAQ